MWIKLSTSLKSKYYYLFLLVFSFQTIFGQVLLDADGPGETYSLITSVFAPGYNPIETPDCSHEGFGDHIDEIFDAELGGFAFRFHIHTEQDDDRCIKFDRQRNEIKTYSNSPDNLLGIEGEKVIYKWKFKLNEGFQSSSSFTHIHQLKSVGGSLASMPIYTLTTRKGTPDKLELRYAKTNSQTTLKKTDLAPFIGTWLEVTETIEYGLEGNYEISINTVDGDTNLFSYSNESIINWRPGAEFVRPKWGIYRSLNSKDDLRDETVLFANFSIEEIKSVSTEDPQLNEEEWGRFFQQSENEIYFKDWPIEVERIQILAINGQIIKEYYTNSSNTFRIDITDLTQGIYVLSLISKSNNQSKLIRISK